MNNHTLNIKIGSEGEQYFVNELMTHCEDKVIVRLGDLFGWPYNQYEITHDDYLRISDYIKTRDGAC